MLEFDMVAENRWDPVFYLLQELSINQRFLEQKRSKDRLLHMIDYFVDYNPAKPLQNPKFFLVYEDFHSNLRDIMEYRRANKQQYPETNLIRILLDLSYAVYSLHRIGIAHRNIRPENIFYNHDSNCFKLGGLGLAYPTEENFIESNDLIGTPFYLPVDLFTHLKLRDNKLVFTMDVFKADVYAIGMIMCELITLQLDTMDMIGIKYLYQMSKVERINNVVDFIRLSEDKVKSHYTMMYIIDEAICEGILSDKFGRLVKSMIDADYIRRIDIVEVKNIVADLVDPTSIKATNNFFFTMSDKHAVTTEKTDKGSQNLTGNMSRLISQFKEQKEMGESRGGSRGRTGSRESKETENSVLSVVSIRQRLKTVIFNRKNKKSAHLPVKNDNTISKDIHKICLVDCQKLKIEQSLSKNEFGLFEILTIAIFLSIINLSEDADDIFQQVQNFYEGRDLKDMAILLNLMICRIKNMSKLRSSKNLAVLIDQLEVFCKEKNLENDSLLVDLYIIKSKVHYCLNQHSKCFKFITLGMELSDKLSEGRESSVNTFLLILVKTLENFKKYQHAYKILLLQNTKKRGKAHRETDMVALDEFWLERECLTVKLLFRLKKFTKAANHFEYTLTRYFREQKEQIMTNYPTLAVELYCYAVLIYLRLDNLSRALQVYQELFGAIEYQLDEQKTFYGIAACLKGVILINRDLNLKLVSRYASLANRMSKSIDLDAGDSCNILMFNMMIKLYLSLGKHSEVESVATSCIKVIERSYCPFHLQAIDFYVFKVDSLIARQKYTEAYYLLAEMAKHFDPLEQYQSQSQILDLMRVNFSVLMDLGMLDELEDFIEKKKSRLLSSNLTSKLDDVANMIEVAESIIGRDEQLFVDEDLDSNRSNHLIIANKKYLVTLDLFSLKFFMKKRDYSAAITLVKTMIEDQENMTKFNDDFEFLLTCAKAMVKGAKHQLGGFSEACMVINELVDQVNATSNFVNKVKGMHEVAMYLFYTGEHQKSLEYLFQAMCYLEAKVVAEQISTGWEVLSLKIRSLSLISKFSESENALNSVSKNLLEYVQNSLKVAYDEFQELDSKSKSFDSGKRIKNMVLLAAAYSRCNEAEQAFDLIETCRARIIEVNNGEFCFQKLIIQKAYAKILMTMGSYEEAMEQIDGGIVKVASLSRRNNNKFIKEKLVALLKDICEKGNLNADKVADFSEPDDSGPVVFEEPA